MISNSTILEEIMDLKDKLHEVIKLLEKQAIRNENIKKEVVQIVDNIVKHHLEEKNG